MLPPLTVEKRSLGVTFSGKNQADVLLWAPTPEHVAIKLTESSEVIPLNKEELGYWSVQTPKIKPDSLYTFVLDDEKECQDPASLGQPEGIEGPSRAIDTTSFQWEDQNWVTPTLENYLLYELHIGTFTPEGTFDAVQGKLDYLKALGINAIEIMPVAQFSNARDWGYDGVFWYAAQDSYGGASGLQRLVNACHVRGIAVVLDVVYNHFGPEGNFLEHYGPYLTDKYQTPWGNAVNFDDAWCDGVRRHVLENALMWFRDFHIDALRMDAVHAIKDAGPVHILQELRQQVDRLMKTTGRRHYLMIECDLNDPKYIQPLPEHGYGMDAQWIDEFHHSLRVTVGEEKTGYYADFDGIASLAKSFRDAYVYDGQFSEVRHKLFGSKAETNPGSQFIVFSQNHDQVGNRKQGERSSVLYSYDTLKLMAGAVLVSPFIPMLFMGEEWGETNPFLYFANVSEPKLAKEIKQGRKDEFSTSKSDVEVPDPDVEETYQQAKLEWELIQQKPHRTLLRYYQTLIALRQQLPALHKLNRQQLDVTTCDEQQTLLLHRWHDDQHVLCLMNFSSEQQDVTISMSASTMHWQKLLDSADQQWQLETGSSTAPNSLVDSTSVTLPAESLVIYACGHEKSHINVPKPIPAHLYQ
ncbi:malto-oligosyltrehalose trehalohydrolase [Spirosoma endophyticum]|uniref:Malto-oligosyltrehalose trehalohydrolase n=1 Tax=Spirosoma endophyticum TaxID=662367 RepID=A0A1I2CPE8_9BACT|nr:malto-oligosyltrehalose trehalohydrolase [Spirosoma endophyticum]SFE70191.1 maltooligosyl trehalose hydrolase [Spirosoma endophyticum]